MKIILLIFINIFSLLEIKEKDILGYWKLYNICIDTNILERLNNPNLERVLDCDNSNELMSLEHIIEFKEDNTYKVTVLNDSIAFGAYDLRKDYIDRLFLSNFADNVDDFKVAEYTYWFKNQKGKDFLVLHNHKNPNRESKLYYYLKQ